MGGVQTLIFLSQSGNDEVKVSFVFLIFLGCVLFWYVSLIWYHLVFVYDKLQ